MFEGNGESLSIKVDIKDIMKLLEIKEVVIYSVVTIVNLILHI